MSKSLHLFLDNINIQMSDFESQLNIESLEIAKNIIVESQKNGGRLHVTGIGKPSYVAGYIASLFSSIGTPTYYLHGTEAVHGSSGQVAKNDVVIAISNSGQTSEMKYTVSTVQKNGAKIIGVSGDRDSWLSNISDVHLYAGVSHEGDILNKPPRASIIIEILILQLLSVILQDSNELDNDKYVKWHPGGALGASVKGGK